MLSAEYTYIHPDKVGKRVVILGAGLVGMELAVFLSMLGRNVTIVEMLDRVNDGGNYQHMKGLQTELDRYRRDNCSFRRKLCPCNTSAASAVSTPAQRSISMPTRSFTPSDSGRFADDAFALSDCAPEFYPVGDCISPKNIMNATGMAYTISQSIGRF